MRDARQGRQNRHGSSSREGRPGQGKHYSRPDDRPGERPGQAGRSFGQRPFQQRPQFRDNREERGPVQDLPIREPLTGIFTKPRKVLTKNLTPGKKFFEEDLWREGGVEYRVLDPRRSKLGAAVVKGLSQSGMKPGSIVLYLGASHGYTPSYVSDIIGKEGFVYCLDFAPRVVRDLVFVCEQRENMAPMLEDAKKPETYAEKLPEAGVDAVYQDIAQKAQVDIFLANCDRFLKQGGAGLLAVKARSIDVTKQPFDIFKEIKRRFESGDAASRYVIVDYRELDPFEKDHAFFVVKKR